MTASVRGMVPIKDGMLRDDCANCRPRLSIRPTAKSQLSLTTEENDVRTKVCAVSSIRPLKRCQVTPSCRAEKRVDSNLVSRLGRLFGRAQLSACSKPALQTVFEIPPFSGYVVEIIAPIGFG